MTDQFVDGQRVVAVDDGFCKMYRRGETGVVLSSGIMNGGLFVRVKLDRRDAVYTAYAYNWEVVKG